MSNSIKSGASSDVATVNTDKELIVALSKVLSKAGYAALVSEIDAGTVSGTPLRQPILADTEGRLRTATDVVLDDETFGYTAQNTGKHVYANTTMTAAWTAAGLQTNSGNITTTTTGVSFYTRAMFPLLGGNNTTIAVAILSLSTAAPSNTTVDFGLLLPGAANPYAPTDGAYFRITNGGVVGVVNNSGSETTTGTFAFTPVINQKARYVIRTHSRKTYFFIDDVLQGIINTPAANGQPFASAALNFGLRHSIVGGAAGAILQVTVTDYTVLLAGSMVSKTLGEIGNAVFGSYQGLSGGTMGGLSVYTNSTNPTAAVPSNTALTANLPGGLGGQAWETFTLALNTDGILMSYQVPAGTVSMPGKRLKITGIKMSAFVQTVLAGGPANSTFSLAYGHTAVSLATAEAAITKKPRIVLLPELTQSITAAQAVNTPISQPGGCQSPFAEPIYVNPGEFIAFVVKHIGTVGTSGTIAYNIQYVYSWE